MCVCVCVVNILYENKNTNMFLKTCIVNILFGNKTFMIFFSTTFSFKAIF